MNPINFWFRAMIGDSAMVVYAVGVGAFSIWFIQVVPLVVAAPVCLGAAWFGGKKAIGFSRSLIDLDPQTGLPTGGQSGVEGIACERCDVWCLASSTLDEPCVCGCPNRHQQPT